MGGGAAAGCCTYFMHFKKPFGPRPDAMSGWYAIPAGCSPVAMALPMLARTRLRDGTGAMAAAGPLAAAFCRWFARAVKLPWFWHLSFALAAASREPSDSSHSFVG